MRSPAGRVVLTAAVAAVLLLALLAGPSSPVAAQEGANTTTTFDVALRADGDAQVSVTARFELADESDRAGFDRLADAHTAGGEDAPLSAEPFERAARLSAEANGREMAIRGVSRTAGRTGDVGRLSLRFTWTNFTDPEAGELAVGDAFRTPEGTWLPGLAEGQELVISFPPGYSPQSISVPGTRYQLVNRTVRIEGPASFEPGTPSLVLQRTETPAGPPWELFAGAAVVVGALGVIAYVYRDGIRSVAGGDGGGAPDAGAEEPAGDGDVDPMAEPLLSDEERVVQLLASRGGRMKQVEIVEATDWSNAKVSQLLSEMEEAGQVDKLRIGRENLISLPGEGPGDG